MSDHRPSLAGYPVSAMGGGFGGMVDPEACRNWPLRTEPSELLCDQCQTIIPLSELGWVKIEKAGAEHFFLECPCCSALGSTLLMFLKPETAIYHQPQPMNRPLGE